MLSYTKYHSGQAIFSKLLKSETPKQSSVSHLFAANGVFFHIGVAIFLVLIRLWLWDYKSFFELNSLPQHDLSDGLAFFTTGMHCQRLTGELAWWNPAMNPGYPQYQQMFLGPLAPTPGHIVFILWAHLISGLALINGAIPEYYQYLLINYICLPFLTFWAFTAFVGNFLKSRAAVLWVCLSYAFSGIGLWQTAWFYFQESFSLWCVMAAFMGFINAPRWNKLLLLLTAGLIQAVSVNYWTIYNSWFYLIVFVSYACVYFTKLRKAALFIQTLSKQRKVILGFLVLGAVVITAMWWFMLGGMAQEQEREQLRGGIISHYEKRLAVENKIEMRQYTTELFNPSVDNARHHYRFSEAIHNARYIGITVLPLLLILALMKWTRLIVWLVICAIALLVICLAPPPLPDLWEMTPGMNRIIHIFYFYTQYWQILLTFLAASALDICLTEQSKKANFFGKSIKQILAVSAVISLLVFVLSFALPVSIIKDPLTQGALYTAALLSTASVVLWMLINEKRFWLKQFYLFLFLTVTFVDLSIYFIHGSELDQKRTKFSTSGYYKLVSQGEMSYRNIKEDIKSNVDLRLSSIANKLKKPWQRHYSQSNFGDNIFENMPIYNYLWPINLFIRTKQEVDLKHQPLELQKKIWQNNSVTFSKTFPQFDLSSSTPLIPLPYLFTRALYNNFAIEFNAPSHGWLLLRHLPDKRWHYYIDGKTAEITSTNLVETAIPVPAGLHLLEMDYQPFARQFYKWCCILLELWLTICLLIVVYGLVEKSRKRKTFPSDQYSILN